MSYLNYSIEDMHLSGRVLSLGNSRHFGVKTSLHIAELFR